MASQTPHTQQQLQQQQNRSETHYTKLNVFIGYVEKFRDTRSQFQTNQTTP